MSKFQKQDVIEEESVKILNASFDPNYFLFNDWGVKDRYPDIDGLVRLRLPTGLYLNKYLHYQLKGVNELKNCKFYCSRDILDYLIDTNVPTTLFVVDLKTQTTYSFLLTKQIISSLNLTKDKKGRTLDLSGYEFNKTNSAKFNDVWQKIAKKDNYNELNASLSKIVADFHKNVRKCVGLLYLLQRVEKDKLPDLFNKLLSISVKEVEVIIEKLDAEGILNKTSKLYLVENELIGIECLFDLVETYDLDTIPKIFKDKEDLKLINKHLALIKHPKVDKYFEQQYSKLLELFSDPSNNDELIDWLEILDGFTFKEPQICLKIISLVIKPKKIIPTKKYRTKYGNYFGKSYGDVLIKTLDLLNNIRYLETKAVLKYLFILSKKTSLISNKKIDELIKHITEYDLHALRKIGYFQQVSILQEIEKFSDKQKISNFNVVIAILKLLLDPSFHGSSMTDYRTFTWSFGGLNVTPALKDIRSRSIALLFKLFSLVSDDKSKLEILKALTQAMYPPSQGNYSKELEELVRENSDEIFTHYKEVIGSLSDTLTQEIDEQVNRFIRHVKDQKSKPLQDLEQLIATNSEYDFFRVFVGFDYKLNKNGDWRAEQVERKQKIQGYVDNISLSNYSAWLDRVKNVANNYDDVDPSKFQYFFEFLNKLGNEKPEIAYKMITENESLFDKFLIQIVAGVYESSKSALASNLISGWAKQNKHLTSCAVVLASSKTYDGKLFLQIANKSISAKNVLAINNVIRGATQHIKADPSLKKLFLECINTLTRLKDTTWVSTIWFRDKDILESFSKDEVLLILDNLIYSPDVEYNTEEILSVFAVKYPSEVISFFYKRLKLTKYSKKFPRYEDLPYSLHELDEVLRKHSDIIVPILLSWFNTKDELVKFKSAHFFKTIFPDFSSDLEAALLGIISKGDENKAKDILVILSAYEGQIFLHTTIQSYIEKYPPNKDTKSSLYIILSSTGVVSGEYGLSEAYKKKKEEIQSWKTSTKLEIRQFAIEYEKYLDTMITLEHTREEDTVTLMKANY